VEAKWKTVCVGLIVGAVAFNSCWCTTCFNRRTIRGAQADRDATEEGDYREGYASFWNANVLTELSDGTVDVRCWGNNDTRPRNSATWRASKPSTLAATEGARDHRAAGKVFLLLNHREYEAFSIVGRLEGRRFCTILSNTGSTRLTVTMRFAPAWTEAKRPALNGSKRRFVFSAAVFSERRIGVYCSCQFCAWDLRHRSEIKQILRVDERRGNSDRTLRPARLIAMPGARSVVRA
jgi:hypothetical protein